MTTPLEDFLKVHETNKSHMRRLWKDLDKMENWNKNNGSFDKAEKIKRHKDNLQAYITTMDKILFAYNKSLMDCYENKTA